MLRFFAACLAASLFVLSAVAEERINSFDVAITVEEDGDTLLHAAADGGLEDFARRLLDQGASGR